MKNDLHVIVGLGITGLSCANYLARNNIPFAVNDTRPNPPHLKEFKNKYPDAMLSLGQYDEQLFGNASKIIISPGLSLRHPMIAKQVSRGIPIVGDIELFAATAHKPIIAITGTNAKSTVTTLVGEMAKATQLTVAVGGNLGKPALDLLDLNQAELYVLELSSFQLETTSSLKAAVATVLNISPDHMDRYKDLEDYCATKKKIYQNCKIAVCNRDDTLTDYDDVDKKNKLYFTLNQPQEREFGLLSKDKNVYLAYEDKFLMPVRELPILGKHYQANALAALAIGYGFGLDMSTMLKVLQTFKGLPHRCQLVRERSGVSWYNDSKGTNVGATLAALQGLGQDITGKLILIAGGVGKNADFSPLILPMEKYVKKVVLIGEAAPILASVIEDRVATCFANSLEEAVMMADASAEKGDSVLLSPACASLDMFNNFEHRGNVFMEAVQALK